MTVAATRQPRGERRRLRTRGAILQAGQQLFASRALDSVTIDDIVAAAAVAKGSFYNHFDDKAGLAGAIVALVQGDCEFHIFAANRGVTDPAMRMARALGVMINYAFAHPERLAAMLSLSQRGTQAGSPLNAGVTSDVADGLTQGRFAGISIEFGVLIALGMIRITISHAMATGSPSNGRALAAGMGAPLLRALGVPAAEAAALADSAARDVLAIEGKTI